MALRAGLIVSCQPVIGGAMDSPAIVAAMARAALDGGAAGLRIEGLANLRAIRAAGVTCPVIGLIKHSVPGSDVYISPLAEDAAALAAAGADIVAFDATLRPRPVPVAALVAAAHAAGAVAMADCATADDAAAAIADGADVAGSTLSGYTGGPVGDEPDLDLVTAMARMGRPVFAEGRYRTPEQAQAALRAGAWAVVVGSAITRIEHIAGWFTAALREAAA